MPVPWPPPPSSPASVPSRPSGPQCRTAVPFWSAPGCATQPRRHWSWWLCVASVDRPKLLVIFGFATNKRARCLRPFICYDPTCSRHLVARTLSRERTSGKLFAGVSKRRCIFCLESLLRCWQRYGHECVGFKSTFLRESARTHIEICRAALSCPCQHRSELPRGSIEPCVKFTLRNSGSVSSR